jgi:hypothetical protein
MLLKTYSMLYINEKNVMCPDYYRPFSMAKVMVSDRIFA